MFNEEEEPSTETHEEETEASEEEEEAAPKAKKKKKAKAKEKAAKASPKAKETSEESKPIHISLSKWKVLKRFAKAKDISIRDAADFFVAYADKRLAALKKYQDSRKEPRPAGKPRKKMPAGEKREKERKRKAKQRKTARENE